MQIKTTMGNHHIPIRMAAIQNKQTENNRCCQGCGETGTLLHCWGEYSAAFTESSTMVPQKIKNRITIWSSNSILSSVQSLSRVQLFATPWIATRQASLSLTNSRSSLRLMSIESVMPSSHLILCRPLLLLPPIPPSIRVSSNESTFRMR